MGYGLDGLMEAVVRAKKSGMTVNSALNLTPPPINPPKASQTKGATAPPARHNITLNLSLVAYSTG